MSEADQLREELKKLAQKYDEMADALEDLVDIQNGPPLVRWADKWSKAYCRANEVLAEHAKFKKL